MTDIENYVGTDSKPSATRAAMGPVGMSPGIGIVSYWQGIVEIVLRVVNMVRGPSSKVGTLYSQTTLRTLVGPYMASVPQLSGSRAIYSSAARRHHARLLCSLRHAHTLESLYHL